MEGMLTMSCCDSVYAQLYAGDILFSVIDCIASTHSAE